MHNQVHTKQISDNAAENQKFTQQLLQAPVLAQPINLAACMCAPTLATGLGQSNPGLMNSLKRDLDAKKIFHPSHPPWTLVVCTLQGSAIPLSI